MHKYFPRQHKGKGNIRLYEDFQNRFPQIQVQAYGSAAKDEGNVFDDAHVPFKKKEEIFLLSDATVSSLHAKTYSHCSIKLCKSILERIFKNNPFFLFVR